MVAFVDLQCPFSAHFARDVLPTVVERFVRRKRLRIELRPIQAVGPDSAAAAAAAIAAGQQDRMWEFSDTFFASQGRENSGYVTRPFVGYIAKSAGGLDVGRLQREILSAGARRALIDNQRASQTARIHGTPAFKIGRTGDVLESFEGRRLGRGDFVRRLEAALGHDARATPE
jgi:protein-disulfide isomerase